MKILLIEDEEIKRNKIVEFLEALPIVETVLRAKSFQSGLRTLIGSRPDLIILDMTMPTFDVGVDDDGGRPQAYGGREILLQMDRRNIRTPVIVVTQFDQFGDGEEAMTLEQLDRELSLHHPTVYRGLVYYNPAVAGWKEVLADRIGSLSRDSPKL